MSNSNERLSYLLTAILILGLLALVGWLLIR